MPDLADADPAAMAAGDAGLVVCPSPLGTFTECPLCGRDLAPEHAHFRCRACGWRDSCCD